MSVPIQAHYARQCGRIIAPAALFFPPAGDSSRVEHTSPGRLLITASTARTTRLLRSGLECEESPANALHLVNVGRYRARLFVSATPRFDDAPLEPLQHRLAAQRAGRPWVTIHRRRSPALRYAGAARLPAEGTLAAPCRRCCLPQVVPGAPSPSCRNAPPSLPPLHWLA